MLIYIISFLYFVAIKLHFITILLPYEVKTDDYFFTYESIEGYKESYFINQILNKRMFSGEFYNIYFKNIKKSDIKVVYKTTL